MARPIWRTPSVVASARRRAVGVLIGVLALSAVSACTGGGATWQGPESTATSDAPLAAELTLVPVEGQGQISPADPVTASITHGTLDEVTLTNADGKQIKGDFDTAKAKWTSSEPLGYGKTYTLTAKGTGDDGKSVDQTRTFKVLSPKNQTYPYIRANDGTLIDGGSFGVGQPIWIHFDESIKDKAAAEKLLTVTTDPPGIVGGWYWLKGRNDQDVHWRPKDEWPRGTKVTVDAKIYGHDLGGGLYGQQDVSASFKINDESHMAVADHDSKRMKVYTNGVQVTSIAGRDVTAGIPISMGKGGSETQPNGLVVDFRTNSGPHVITLSYDVYRMTSASFGITDPKSKNYYDTNIKKAMRISGDGEFVHSRDWDVSQMGNLNTSHGCINVPVVYMDWFYATFKPGDIVNVTGTTKTLDMNNGLGDWVVSWDDWVKGSALYTG